MEEIAATEVKTALSTIWTWLVNHEDAFIDFGINILIALFIFWAGSIISKMASRFVVRVLERRNIDTTVSSFLSSIVRYSILAITVVAVLGRLGVQTTSIVAIFGAAGLAVGLALQGSLANFAAGVLLVIFRPFRVGEYITVGTTTGTVDSIQIFSTTIITSNNQSVVIPNNQIISGVITNFSRLELRRIDLTIGISYDAKIEDVKRIIGEVIAKHPLVSKKRAPMVRLRTMSPSSIDFVVRAWTKTGDYWDVYYDLMEGIKVALDENDINIPYPQMDVRLIKD